VPLTEEQVQRSMATTPSEPITQQQFMQQIRSNEKRKSTSITKDDLFSSLGVKQRNRRQDRIGRGETTEAKNTFVSSSLSTQQQEKLRQEREEWFASQKLPIAKDYDDNQYNVDAQWGRRKKQKENPEEEAITVKNRKDRRKTATPTVDLDDEDYWSDFLTSSSSSSSESSEHDDLFSDLLAELSYDVKERKEEGISTDSTATKGKKEEEQDIFNSLEESLLQKQDKKKLNKKNKEVLNFDEQVDSSLTVEEEDFFSKLDEELTDLLEGGKESELHYVDGGSDKVQKPIMENDFYSASKTEQMERSNNNGSNTYGDEKIYMKEEVASWTLTALKEKLRERGLKVSGKKSELIERLLSL